MNTKYLILITVFLFTASVGSLFWMQQTGPFSADIPLHGPVHEEEHTVYAADGTGIFFTLSEPADSSISKKADFVILMADRNLDRDWNTTAVRFFTGRDLAQYLSSAGYSVIRADQRGTGMTQPSGLNYADPENAASDLLRIMDWAAQEKQASGFKIIAHGEACSAAVTAESQKIKGYILLSCVSRGSLLDTWGDRLLHNMKKAGVPEDILKQSEKDLAYWIQSKKEGRTPERKPADSTVKTDAKSEEKALTADQIAFFKALEFMDTSEKMNRWPSVASGLVLSEDIKKVLKKGIPVLHLTGSVNTEIPEDVLLHWQEKEVPELSSAGQNLYEFKIISKADHFFKDRSSKDTSALDVFLMKMDPFKKTSGELLLLSESWLNSGKP